MSFSKSNVGHIIIATSSVIAMLLALTEELLKSQFKDSVASCNVYIEQILERHKTPTGLSLRTIKLILKGTVDKSIKQNLLTVKTVANTDASISLYAMQIQDVSEGNLIQHPKALKKCDTEEDNTDNICSGITPRNKSITIAIDPFLQNHNNTYQLSFSSRGRPASDEDFFIFLSQKGDSKAPVEMVCKVENASLSNLYARLSPILKILSLFSAIFILFFLTSKLQAKPEIPADNVKVNNDEL